jgi:hypothetical protein
MNMSKQLRLEKGVAEGRAVDGDEGPVAAGRTVVQVLAHDVLADSDLSRDEHLGFAARHLLDGGAESCIAALSPMSTGSDVPPGNRWRVDIFRIGRLGNREIGRSGN